MMRTLFAIGLVAILSADLSARQWPAWRGPDGSGIVRSGELPLNWSRDAGVAWRVGYMRRGMP